MIINQVPLSVKLIDFGGGTVITNSSAADAPDKTGKYMDTTVIGTPGYQAPESLIGRTGAFTDIFSIGCVLNFMLTGEDPGFKSYQGRSSIQYIIRKSTNEDPSMRIKSLIELERLCRHELRYGLSDRIPIIRSVPGYRSHTKWKSVVASMYYLLMLYELVVLFRHYPVLSFTLTTVFWVVIPSIIIGNIGYVQEYFPEKLKQNNRLFILLKTAIFLVCLFVPLILY